MISAFYDDLSQCYHLISPDWEASIARQAESLNQIIHQEASGPNSHVRDVSCGIGTQSLGLARLGYDVVASALSVESVERAKHEAELRSLPIRFSVADMREVFDHHREMFDVVLSCDNSVPHLLSDSDI